MSLDDELKQLIGQNRLIEAIKLYREQTGCGLKEAKDYIDSLAGRAPTPVAQNIDDDYLRSLVMSGRKVEAVKLYREKIGCGLKEAKDYIDSLQS